MLIVKTYYDGVYFYHATERERKRKRTRERENSSGTIVGDHGTNGNRWGRGKRTTVYEKEEEKSGTVTSLASERKGRSSIDIAIDIAIAIDIDITITYYCVYQVPIIRRKKGEKRDDDNDDDDDDEWHTKKNKSNNNKQQSGLSLFTLSQSGVSLTIQSG